MSKISFSTSSAGTNPDVEEKNDELKNNVVTEENNVDGEGESNSDSPNPNNNFQGVTSEYDKENGDFNKEYIDKRFVTITPVKNYSLYRQTNEKHLDVKNDYIGSSIDSSRILSSNDSEVKAYFPALIGVSANNESFTLRVKQYLNNIQVFVPSFGKKLDVSFRYTRKADYNKILQEELNIEDRFKANKQKGMSVKQAVSQKISELNDLESTKHNYGRPVILDDYLIYRHCLLYKDVAKDTALINNTSARFYFSDDKKEIELQKRKRAELNKAKANFVSLASDTEGLFDAVYIQYCVSHNMPIISSMLEERYVKEERLDKFSIDNPVKFNKIFNDKDLRIKAVIEQLISRGEWIRMDHNQNIITSDSVFIGSNVSEAVSWFKNPDNTAQITAYKNLLNK